MLTQGGFQQASCLRRLRRNGQALKDFRECL
jgi:hypothetical protein